MNYNIGDLVYHKTGGPCMCVVAVTDSMVATSWWDENYNGFQSGWFMKDIIQPDLETQ